MEYDPDRNRTCDLWFRNQSQALGPSQLQGQDRADSDTNPLPAPQGCHNGVRRLTPHFLFVNTRRRGLAWLAAGALLALLAAYMGGVIPTARAECRRLQTGASMANPFADIDRMVARFNADHSRVKKAVKDARASGFKVMPTGVWKCRFKPYGAERVDVRATGPDELLGRLQVLVKKSAADKEAAKLAREQQLKAHRAQVARVRGELRELGARRLKVHRLSGGGRQWTCQIRNGAAGLVHEFEGATSEVLLARVRSHVQVPGGRGYA